MSGLDLEEHPASSPGARRLLGWLGIVIGSGAVAVVLLVALVVFGPFAGIRSIFVTHDPHWGTCPNFSLSGSCNGIPLSTVETVTGLELPAGSRVIDSTATGTDFKGHRNLSALIAYPTGQASPFTGPQVVRGPEISADNRIYRAQAAALAAHGVRRYAVFTSPPRLTSWTCVTGVSGNTTFVAVAVYRIDVHSTVFGR